MSANLDKVRKLEEMKEKLATKVKKLKEAKKINQLEQRKNQLSEEIERLRELKAKRKSGLGFLLESELERAETILAAQEITRKLQDMAEDLAKMTTEDLMPLVDSMKANFSAEAADKFNASASEQLNGCLNTVRTAKDVVNDDILRLEGKISDEDVSMPSNDMTDDEESNVVPFAKVDKEPKAEEPEEVDMDVEEDPFAGSEAASGPADEPLGRRKKVAEARKKVEKEDKKDLKTEKPEKEAKGRKKKVKIRQ